MPITTKKRHKSSVWALSVCLAVGVHGTSRAAEDSPIAVGDFHLTASFDLGLEHDDNIYREESSEQSSSIFRIQPELSLTQESGDFSIELGYDGNYALYNHDSDDNYEDHELSANLERRNLRSRFGTRLGLSRGNEPRGTGSSEGVNTALVDGPASYDQADVEVYLGLGNAESKSDFELALSYQDIEFNDFRTLNAGRDRDVTRIAGTYRYRYSAATNLFVEASHRMFDYSDLLQGFTTELDGDESRLHGGVEWSVNELIAGRIGVGYTGKELDGLSSDFGGVSWDMQLEWTPTPSDTLLFSTAKTPNESQGSGSFQLTTDYYFSWIRNLNRRWEAEFFVGLTDIELEDDQRDEDITTFRLSATYVVNKRSDLTISLSTEEKDSNVSSFEYDRNVIAASFVLAL